MTFESNSPSVSILELDCYLENNNTKKEISILSNFTMFQLHAILLSAFNLNSLHENEHMFKTEPINTNEKLKNITYLPIFDPNHFDGWLTSVVPGVYVEHAHPHAPVDQDNEITMSQVRAEHMWSVGLVLTSNQPELLYINNDEEQDIKIYLRIRNVRKVTNDDTKLYYNENLNQCYLCKITNCTNGDNNNDSISNTCAHSTGEACCDYCLHPNLQGWQGLGTSDEFESRIYELVNQACVFIKRERATFIEANNLRILSRNNNNTMKFHCQWIESTGETCAYCTEDFL